MSTWKNICYKSKGHLSRLETKPTKWHVRPAKTQISLCTHPVWSESSLSAGRNLGPLATYWAHSKDSDQTGRIPRLIWVFAGRTVILLVLSLGGSVIDLCSVSLRFHKFQTFTSNPSADQSQMRCNTTKPTEWHVGPGKAHISLGIHPFQSDFLCALSGYVSSSRQQRLWLDWAKKGKSKFWISKT